LDRWLLRVLEKAHICVVMANPASELAALDLLEPPAGIKASAGGKLEEGSADVGAGGRREDVVASVIGKMRRRREVAGNGDER
jgi:hypothetical protein